MDSEGNERLMGKTERGDDAEPVLGKNDKISGHGGKP
jgi:hypothetical protein